MLLLLPHTKLLCKSFLSILTIISLARAIMLPAVPKNALSDYGMKLSRALAPCFETMLLASLQQDEQRDTIYK